jgi:hypothetical protein
MPMARLCDATTARALSHRIIFIILVDALLEEVEAFDRRLHRVALAFKFERNVSTIMTIVKYLKDTIVIEV